VRLIERIPGWPAIPELVALRTMHAKSFRELRLADPEVDAAAYAQVIGKIRQRHKRTGHLFAGALQKIDFAIHSATSMSSVNPDLFSSSSVVGIDGPASAPPLDSRRLEEWCESFLSSRVSTEMQMSHYEACLGASQSGDAPATKIGILDAHCDPFDICQQAIARVQDGPHPCVIEAENLCGDLHVCQAPRYLFFIMMELLHNSARATCVAAGPEEQQLKARPIKVTVCANDVQVVIRVSDRGGGMPQIAAEHMWSYAFRAGRKATQPFEDVETDDEDENRASSKATARALPWGVFAGEFAKSPLSGPGMGLPLSRLYARYLGGTLEVINMPGVGVDAYLFLTRIDPPDVAASLNSITMP